MSPASARSARRSASASTLRPLIPAVCPQRFRIERRRIGHVEGAGRLQVNLIEDEALPAGRCSFDLPAAAETAPPPVVWAGKRCVSAVVSPRPRGATALTCRLHPAVARHLLLPHPLPAPLGGRLSADGLHLGPVVGVFLGDGSEDTAMLLEWTQRYVAPARATGIVYAFGLADLRLAELAVQGRLRRGDGAGFGPPEPLPLPDAVWKRGEVNAPWFERLCDGHLFNRRVDWSKAEVHAALTGLAHVPPAVRATLQDPLPVEGLLRSAGALYLKPVYGSMARGIARLSRAAAGPPESWLLEGGGEPFRGSPAEVLAEHRRRTPSPHGYLAQSAIEPRPDGRRLDFRVMVQRGAGPDLACTAIWASLGLPGALTSNRNAGGQLMTAAQALRLSGREDGYATTLLADVARGALRLTRRLEDALGHIGEAGLDVTLDPGGDWWLLEANPRPNPVPWGEVDPEGFRRVAAAPLQHAAALAGYLP